MPLFNRCAIIFGLTVPLIVWLEVNGTKIEKETLEVYSNVYTLIFCNATGKRLPPGSLSWKLNNNRQQNEIEEGNNDNFTWSSFGFKPRDDDRSLSCTTNEQTKLRNVEISVKLNVLCKYIVTYACAFSCIC